MEKMTGKELIDWIRKNNAENMIMAVQYRDSSGTYMGAEDVYPMLARVQGSGLPFDETYIDVDCESTTPNAVVL